MDTQTNPEIKKQFGADSNPTPEIRDNFASPESGVRPDVESGEVHQQTDQINLELTRAGLQQPAEVSEARPEARPEAVFGAEEIADILNGKINPLEVTGQESDLQESIFKAAEENQTGIK